MRTKIGTLVFGLAVAATMAFVAIAPSGSAFAADPSTDGVWGCPGGPGDHGFFDHPGLRRSIVVAAADVIGIPVERVVNDLEHGMSLNEIGRAHGVTTERLEIGILRHERVDLDRLIAEGRITRDEARLVMIFLENHIDQIVRHHGLDCYDAAPAS